MTEDEELSDRERRTLADMRIDVAPPPGLEERVVAALSAAGMLRRRSTTRVLAAAAALFVAFSAGLWSEHRWSQPRVPEGPRFVFLLYGGTGAAGEHHAEYADWAKALASQGVHIDGEELSAERVDVSKARPSRDRTAGPNGYFIVSARTMDDARRIAESCPHVRYDGEIVIRPIVAAR